MIIIHDPPGLSNHDSIFLAAALNYQARGWSIIPLTGKKATNCWKKFQAQPADAVALRRMFASKSTTGLAVIMGGVSGGLGCRDFDKAESYYRWAADHSELARTLPTAQTHRGFHVYFHTVAEQFVNLNDGEYRADSKHYTALPPSRHPEGGVYNWLIKLPSGALPSVTDPSAAGLISAASSKTSQRISLSRQSCSTKQSADPASNNNVSLSQQAATPSPIHSVTHPPIHLLHVSDQEIENAISATRPTGPGQRNRRIFDFARRLKTLMPSAANEKLKPNVQSWWKQASPFTSGKHTWSDTWIDFLVAWENVRCIIGKQWAEIMQVAKDIDCDTGDYEGEVADLIRLCAALQAHHGNGQSWALSCRKAGEAIGVSHDTAATYLKGLRADGVITLVKLNGGKGSRVAREYVFLGVR